MTIQRMRIACWVPKATDIHSEYVIRIAFPQHNGCKKAPQYYAIRHWLYCYLLRRWMTSFRTATKSGLLDTVYCGAWQSHRSDSTNRTVYSPRTVHRRNTTPVTVTAVMWQTQLKTPSCSFNTHPWHKSVTAAHTPLTNEPSACLWTHYLPGTAFVSPLCRTHIRNISVGFVITPPDGWYGFRLPSETINLAPLQSGPAVGPTLVPIQRVPRGSFQGYTGRGLQLTTQSHLQPSSRMSGALPLLPLCALTSFTVATSFYTQKQKILQETKPRPQEHETFV